MVYSIVCRWLDDYLADEELEISDSWDFMEWVEESQIIEVFQDCVLKTFKQESTRNDAEMILYSLLWEYYLLQRDLANGRIEPDTSAWTRIESSPSIDNWPSEKRNFVIGDEFYLLLEKSNGRKRLLKNKVSKRVSATGGTVVTGLDAATPTSAIDWNYKYLPVMRNIYACGSSSLGRRYRHPTLPHLAAEPAGIVYGTGRLLGLAVNSSQIEDELIPDPYYIRLQVEMEVCGLAAADFCECYISAGTTWKLGAEIAVGGSVGAVAVVGLPDATETWRYEYSPLYDNTAEGRALAEAWLPVVATALEEEVPVDADALLAEEQVQAHVEEQLLEKHLWEIEKIQTITVKRNPRWWAAVGLPAYVDFWKHVDAVRSDPMFLSPAFLDGEVPGSKGTGPGPVGPMFVD